MTRKINPKRLLHTVLCENYMLHKETGEPVKQSFILYSAPTSPAMAKSLAENLKRCNKSYRIQTDDGKGEIIEEWLREGFIPDDRKESK